MAWKGVSFGLLVPLCGIVAALLMTEQNFRNILGYRGLWTLKAALDQNEVLVQQEVA